MRLPFDDDDAAALAAEEEVDMAATLIGLEVIVWRRRRTDDACWRICMVHCEMEQTQKELRCTMWPRYGYYIHIVCNLYPICNLYHSSIIGKSWVGNQNFGYLNLFCIQLLIQQLANCTILHLSSTIFYDLRQSIVAIEVVSSAIQWSSEN